MALGDHFPVFAVSLDPTFAVPLIVGVDATLNDDFAASAISTGPAMEATLEFVPSAMFDEVELVAGSLVTANAGVLMEMRATVASNAMLRLALPSQFRGVAFFLPAFSVTMSNWTSGYAMRV